MLFSYPTGSSSLANIRQKLAGVIAVNVNQESELVLERSPLIGHFLNKDTSVARTVCCVPNMLSLVYID